MTFYQPGLGACGINSSPSQHVCALSHSVFDAAGKAAGGNSNGNPLCGRKIRIGGRGGGKTVEATVVDRCMFFFRPLFFFFYFCLSVPWLAGWLDVVSGFASSCVMKYSHAVWVLTADKQALAAAPGTSM